MPLRFEWDSRKESLNRRKHGVSFQEAESVFYDDHALLVSDPDHSETEDRFILVGMSSRFRILIVCHCYRKQDDIIRLISSRKANQKERKQYDARWNK
jgi:uncharacterized protein